MFGFSKNVFQLSEICLAYRTGRRAILSGLVTPFTARGPSEPQPRGGNTCPRVLGFSSLNGRGVAQAPLPGQAPAQPAQQAVAEGLEVTPSGQGWRRKKHWDSNTRDRQVLRPREIAEWTTTDEIWKSQMGKCVLFVQLDENLNAQAFGRSPQTGRDLLLLKVRVSFLTSSNFILPSSGLSHELDLHGLWHDPDNP